MVSDMLAGEMCEIVRVVRFELAWSACSAFASWAVRSEWPHDRVE